MRTVPPGRLRSALATRSAAVRGTGEQGSLLLLALLTLTLIAFLVVSPLGLADTNLRAAVTYHADRRVEAAADDAVTALAAFMRTHPDQGLPYSGLSSSGHACPDTAAADWTAYVLSHPQPAVFNGIPVAVTCVGVVPATGVASGERDVVFTASCGTAPPAGTCVAGATLVRARLAWVDSLATPGVKAGVLTWSATL